MRNHLSLLGTICALAAAPICGGCSADESVSGPPPARPETARPAPADDVVPTPASAPATAPHPWVTREAGGIVSIARTWRVEAGTPNVSVSGASVTASFFGQSTPVGARPMQGTCRAGAPELASDRTRVDAGELAVDPLLRGQGILVRPTQEYRYAASFDDVMLTSSSALLVRVTGAAFPQFEQQVSWPPSAAIESVSARRGTEGTIDVAWPAQARNGVVVVTLRNGSAADAAAVETCSAAWTAGRVVIDPKALGLEPAPAPVVGVELVVATEVQPGAQSAIVELSDRRELTVH